MNDDDALFCREQFVLLLKQIHEIGSAQEALLRVVVESFPPEDGRRILDKYESYKAQFSEDVLLKLEDRFPRLAADLDAQPPLLPPDEKGQT